MARPSFYNPIPCMSDMLSKPMPCKNRKLIRIMADRFINFVNSCEQCRWKTREHNAEEYIEPFFKAVCDQDRCIACHMNGKNAVFYSYVVNLYLQLNFACRRRSNSGTANFIQHIHMEHLALMNVVEQSIDPRIKYNTHQCMSKMENRSRHVYYHPTLNKLNSIARWLDVGWMQLSIFDLRCTRV